jgi:hypothetical protein
MTTLHPAAIPCGATRYPTTTKSRVLAVLLRMLAPLAWLR